MRTRSSVAAVSVATAASLLLAPAAYAAPGDNGTVKIHKSSTGEEFRKNEPKVCEFYLDAFGFDAVQEVSWRIVEMPPTGVKDKLAEEGTLTLDDKGHGRSSDLKLADGHYKLYWKFEGQKGAAKHKVFWSDCEDEDTPGGEEPEPEPSGSTPGEETPGEETPGGETPGGETPGGETPGGETPGDKPAPSGEPTPGAPAGDKPQGGGGGGDLAETGAGAPVGALAAAAAALLGAGGYLALRRRRATSAVRD
ncbi:LPXTG cell wall anchor domain-containing protein [Streptomyces durbertensis]|uniref:LPXTG cell wall anchor domain-containing protein n=1 Tax=Streptomyces durbertensis TaxID=2448886 RepID=A0ABR6EAF9_9ACTN|nr:LPXTG cell wall anchor domain-containing protein [Streptomyces durbertensis]MBB1242313.1 LPXTG cell wall anchor domain-containing protein [Streptomyces durbertensis]